MMCLLLLALWGPNVHIRGHVAVDGDSEHILMKYLHVHMHTIHNLMLKVIILFLHA
jgi:hypothetical protein